MSKKRVKVSRPITYARLPARIRRLVDDLRAVNKKMSDAWSATGSFERQAANVRASDRFSAQASEIETEIAAYCQKNGLSVSFVTSLQES